MDAGAVQRAQSAIAALIAVLEPAMQARLASTAGASSAGSSSSEGSSHSTTPSPPPPPMSVPQAPPGPPIALGIDPAASLASNLLRLVESRICWSLSPPGGRVRRGRARQPALAPSPPRAAASRQTRLIEPPAHEGASAHFHSWRYPVTVVAPKRLVAHSWRWRRTDLSSSSLRWMPATHGLFKTSRVEWVGWTTKTLWPHVFAQVSHCRLPMIGRGPLVG